MPTTRPARVSRYVAGLGAAALVATGLASAGAAFGADDRPAGQFTEITRVDGVDAGGNFSVTTTTVGGVPVLPGPTLAGATTDPQSTGLARLAGSSRYETAVAVSRRAFAAGQARSVYLARGDRLGDALAGGSLTDGPVLLVPPSGPVPQLVLDEVRRLGASEVVAIGGSVSASTLSAVAAGRATARLAGSDDFGTSAAVARRAFPSGATEVYLSAAGGSPDAVAGGALTKGPVLQVPSTGAAPASVTQALAALRPSRVVALGGPATISDATLSAAAAGRATGRLAGANRYATAAAIATHAFPRGSAVAYLAGGTAFADAAVGGGLTDGPILLVPPAGVSAQVRQATSGALQRLGATAAGVLGGAGAVSESALAPVLAGAPNVVPGTLPPVPSAEPPTSSPSPSTNPPSPSSPPSPSTTSSPSPSTTSSPSPSSTSPTSRPPVTTESCDTIIGTFRPIPLDSRYTASCVDSLSSDGMTLGLTTTSLYRDGNETFAGGTVKIVRKPDLSLVQEVIAHEFGHAYSYSDLTKAQRDWFVVELGKTDSGVNVPAGFGGSDYTHMPAEQWARGQASCVGYADRYRRPTASCSLIEATKAYRP